MDVQRRREQNRAANRSYYQKTRGAVAAENNRKKSQRHLAILSRIKERYGCMNPECKWQGKLPPCCLDFHHLDETNKRHVSQLVLYRTEVILDEVKKCTLLCAICHRMATYDALDCSGFRRCEPCEADISNL